jgi:hypothetical protein
MPIDASKPPGSSDLFRALLEAFRLRNEILNRAESQGAATSEPAQAKRKPGTACEQITIGPDFDDRLPDDVLALFKKGES